MTAADRPLSTEALTLLTTDPGPWLSCDDCFRLVDRFVEALLTGGPGAPGAELAAMPAHLAGCSACAEEATTVLLLAAADEDLDAADVVRRLTTT